MFECWNWATPILGFEQSKMEIELSITPIVNGLFHISILTIRMSLQLAEKAIVSVANCKSSVHLKLVRWSNFKYFMETKSTVAPAAWIYKDVLKQYKYFSEIATRMVVLVEPGKIVPSYPEPAADVGMLTWRTLPRLPRTTRILIMLGAVGMGGMNSFQFMVKMFHFLFGNVDHKVSGRFD